MPIDLSTWVFTQFTDVPDINGQYLDGRPKYNVTVPLKGEILIPKPWPGKTLLEAQTALDAHRDEYNAMQVEQSLDPAVRVNVGYHLDVLTGLITTYHQTMFPGYKEPPATWTNWGTPHTAPTYEIE
jgi:hypothetical protein